jgi:hypothetical protein
MVAASSMYDRDEKFMQHFNVKSLKGKDHLEDLGVDGRKTLTRCVRMDSFVLGYGPVTGSYESKKRSSDSIKRCWIYRLVKWLLFSGEELQPMELFLRSKYFYILFLNYGV